MSLKFVFVLSLIFTVLEHFSSSKVSSLFSAAENRQPSINVTISGDLKANQSRNVLLTSLKDAETSPDCSSGSWNSSSKCTEFSQVYFGINSTNINKEKETSLPPHEDSASVAALSANADNVSLHDHPVRTTTIGKDKEKKIIMSYVVAQPREIRNFPLNSIKYTNMAEIRFTRESPRMRRARSKTKSVSKTLFKEGFVATKPAILRPKPNGKSRKQRHWPGSGAAIESPRNRRIRVTKKFPAEFESVLKRVFPDNFVTTVLNNNYYRSGNKMQSLGYETDFLGFNRKNYRSLKSYYLKQPFHEPRQKEFSLFRATNENGDHTRDPFSFTNHLWPPMSRTIASDETKSPYKFRVQLWPPVSSKISDKIKNFQLTVPLNSHGSNEEETENFYKTKSSFRFIAPHTANKSSKTETKHSEKEERFLWFHSLTSPSQSNKAEIKYFHTIKNPFRLTTSPRLSELSNAENTHSAKAKRPSQFTIPPRQIKLRKSVAENSGETEIIFRFTVPSRLSKASKARTKSSDDTKNTFRFTIPPWLNKSTTAGTENSDVTKSIFLFNVSPIASTSSKAGSENADETSTQPAQLSKSKANTTPIPIQPRSKVFSQTEKSETEGMIGKFFRDTNTKLVPNVDYHYHFHHFEGFDWETLPTLIHFD